MSLNGLFMEGLECSMRAMGAVGDGDNVVVVIIIAVVITFN